MGRRSLSKRMIGITLAVMIAVTPFFSTHAAEGTATPDKKAKAEQTQRVEAEDGKSDQDAADKSDSKDSGDAETKSDSEGKDSGKDKDSSADDKNGSTSEKDKNDSDAKDSKDASGTKDSKSEDTNSKDSVKESKDSEDKATKSVYKCKKSDVEITAELSEASAIPDDAELTATLITSKTSGYNYDAYMEALNEGADKSAKEPAYTSDNTILYDLAFIKDGKELEPTGGTVSVTFDFKDDQLSDKLGAEKASDVNLVHLPLKEKVREKYDTTKAAKSIDAKDIEKEVIKSSLEVSLKNETAKFKTKDFSVFAYTVDFEYEGYNFSMPGGTSIELSKVFKQLGIDKTVKDVENVTFSNPKLIEVKDELFGSDWTLTSLKAFSTKETLTITLNNGSTFVINVTDDQTEDQGEPYAYSISADKTVTLSEDYTGHWYLLSTLTDGAGSNYYSIKEVNLSSLPQTGSINAFYNADQLATLPIGSESSTPDWAHLVTRSYHTGDTVKNVLVFAKNAASNYGNLINDGNFTREVFGDKGVIETFDVSSTSEGATGTISMTTVSDLKLKSAFEDENGSPITEGYPTDYKLLIKMVRDGNTYYALESVTTDLSEPVKFYKCTGEGWNTQIGTTPYYYSGNGSETISTQVVTGASKLDGALIDHRVSGAVFYNENTIEPRAAI